MVAILLPIGDAFMTNRTQKSADEFIGETDADNIELKVDGALYRKHLSMSGIGANPGRAKMLGRRVRLCRWSGSINGVTDFADASGEVFTALTGEFRADVYDDDGAVVASWASDHSFLPGGFQEGMLRRLASIPADMLAAGVAVDIEWWAEPAANGAGYRYIARNLAPSARGEDKIEKIRARSDAAQLRLASNGPGLIEGRKIS
jgi:hypothetical protein